MTVMTDGVARAVATRPTGSFVSLTDPARRGETIRVYLTGLGPTTPPIGTNSIPVAGIDSLVNGQVLVGVTNAAGQGVGVPVTQAQLLPGVIATYEVAFQLPADTLQSNNTALSVQIIPAGATAPIYSNTTKIPVQ
jgi:uncharacterized protein (TIGR03437 family)